MLARRNYLKTTKLSNVSQTNFRYYKKFLKAYSGYPKDEMWQANYIEILRINAKSLGVSETDINNVIDKLKTLTPYEFKVAFNEDKYLQNMYDYYLAWKESSRKSSSLDDGMVNEVKENFETLSLNIDLVIDSARATAKSGRIKY